MLHILFGQPLEDRPEPCRSMRQILRQDPRISDDGHEAGVAVPPRNEVNVQVVQHAGAGRTPKVDAGVDTVRRIGLSERHLGEPGQRHQLRAFVRVGRRKIADVAVRHHHQMSVIVGIKIEDDVAETARVEDQVGVSAPRLAEDAGAVVGRGAFVLTVGGTRHVGQPPGRPEVFHYTPRMSGGAGGAELLGAGAGATSLLMSSFSSFPGLKYGTFFGGTSTLSPVFGLRPLRGSRLRSRKLPKPRNSIFSPRCSASMMLRNTVSTMTSECFLVRSETRETSSTSSALVMLPPVILPSFR